MKSHIANVLKTVLYKFLCTQGRTEPWIWGLFFCQAAIFSQPSDALQDIKVVEKTLWSLSYCLIHLSAIRYYSTDLSQKWKSEPSLEGTERSVFITAPDKRLLASFLRNSLNLSVLSQCKGGPARMEIFPAVEEAECSSSTQEQANSY